MRVRVRDSGVVVGRRSGGKTNGGKVGRVVGLVERKRGRVTGLGRIEERQKRTRKVVFG